MNNKKSLNNTGLYFSLLISLLVASACTTAPERAGPGDDAVDCYIIYDAGSSATRLFIYEDTATGWKMHKGPETDALADPVRRNRGKSMTDANAVIADVLIALDDMRRDGPPGKNGAPQWAAFDWHTQCIVRGAAVFATAGMRLAEQQDARASGVLWKRLNRRLSKKLGMDVTTRTLTEYEEGLYAWLALRELQADGDFGVAEMGGASLQVTFPCPSCQTARPVRVNGQVIPVFSHSFLRWGQDEAWKRHSNEGSCSRGAGLKYSDWRVEDCADGFAEFERVATDVAGLIKSSSGFYWYLGSAFRYMQSTDIDNFCRKGINSGFEPESSCFRAVYLENVLDTLGLSDNSAKTDANWTLGAVVCSATRCLDTQ